MDRRINIYEIAPESYKHIIALEESIQNSKLSKTHIELIKLRASQINGCAYCINMHTEDALKNGETPRRISLLNAWRETEIYSEEEKLILEMTEEVTLIHKGGLSDSTYKKAKRLFDEEYIAFIILAIAQINTWNRLAISSKQIVK